MLGGGGVGDGRGRVAHKKDRRVFDGDKSSRLNV